MTNILKSSSTRIYVLLFTCLFALCIAFRFGQCTKAFWDCYFRCKFELNAVCRRHKPFTRIATCSFNWSVNRCVGKLQIRLKPELVAFEYGGSIRCLMWGSDCDSQLARIHNSSFTRTATFATCFNMVCGWKVIPIHGKCSQPLLNNFSTTFIGRTVAQQQKRGKNGTMFVIYRPPTGISIFLSARALHAPFLVCAGKYSQSLDRANIRWEGKEEQQPQRKQASHT